MRIIFNEDQILRLKQRLSKENVNEDVLDDLISKGSDYIKKGVSAAKDFIAGLDNDVEKKSDDEPTKADFVGDNVEDLFKILEGIDTPITQQTYGSMTRQQAVEAVQIGLQLLGYSLPKFGTDGLFGSETAAAVNKFKLDNNIKEEIQEAFVTIGDTSYSHVKVDRDSGGDQVNQALLDDLQAAGEAAGVVITITTASSGHNKKTITGKDSRHGFGTAVDIALLNGVKYGNAKWKEYGDAVKDALVSMGYKHNTEVGNDKAILWQTSIGGNHYNHLHVSNKTGVSGAPAMGQSSGDEGGEQITPIMVKVLVDELRKLDITSEDLKKYVDPATTTGGSAEFTDLDLNENSGVEAYKKICDNYIQKRDPGAEVTGEMMARAAERIFKTYGKYLPPELALAQLTLEGGIDSADDSVPMITKNPYNIGNTGKKTNTLSSFQQGVDLYYDLMARKYLVKGKTANDLVNDFRNVDGNRYASSTEYEAGLKSLIKSIRRANAPIYASLSKNKAEALSEELLNEADKRQAIKNAIGLNDAWADEFHRMSDKLSIWIASTFVNKMIELYRSSGDITQDVDPKAFTVERLNGQGGPQGNDSWRNRYRDAYEYIMHWIRAPRREQLNIRDLSFDQAYSLAEEWHDSLQIRKESNFTETGEVFIDYRDSDGVGYYWVNLHKTHCSAEQERMGHCGRASQGGELISLRRINQFGEGESYITIDYRPGGVLGDFHRHGNKKPTSRFHRQIVDFLINTTYPVTSLTRQGVHRYEDNFHLSDLSPADLKRVYDNNPSLKYDINNEAVWPEIIDGVISGDINFNSYPAKIKIKLLKKSKSLNKEQEFLTKFNDEIVVNIFGNIDELDNIDKATFTSAFGGKLNDLLKRKFDLVYDSSSSNEAKTHFIDSLRAISQDLFNVYQSFCDYIDYGFKKFSEETRVEIVSSRGIKRTIFSCSDTIPFLQRFTDNTPIDMNGNISVKTEEGLWGLVKQTGETILHPQFLAVAPNPIDRGKTYMVKNQNGEFYKLNIADMSYTKLEKKR